MSEGRKRALGDAVPVRLRTGPATRWALAAGVQLRRTAAPPLVHTELELGLTVKLLLEPPHPFTVIPPMDSDMKNVIDAQGDRKTQHDLRERRLAAVRHWRQRAHDLRETSLAIINDLQDEPLRNHHLKGDATKTKLGEFTHVALWKEMCETVQHTDTSFIEGLVSGFPVVGRVQRSHICRPFRSTSRPPTR